MSVHIPEDILKILRIIRHSLGAFSIVVNLLTVFVIVRFSGKSAATYRTFLLILQCPVALGDLFSAFVLSPIFLSPTPCYYGDGILLRFLPFRPGYSLGIYVFFIVMNCNAYAACFVYRHKCAMPKPSKLFNTYSYVIVVSLGSLFMLGDSVMITIFTEPHQLLDDIITNHFGNISVEKKKRIDCMQTQAFTGDWNLCNQLIPVATIHHEVSVSMHIFHTLKASLSTSARRVRYQKEMTRALIVQSLIPSMMQVGPDSVIIMQYLRNDESNLVTMIATELLALHSVAHCIILVLTTPSYRRAVLRHFSRPLTAVADSISPTAVVITLHLAYAYNKKNSKKGMTRNVVIAP